MNKKIASQIPFITLVGPPNSGKTTLFNYLSGKNYKTVNYPGSTVSYTSCRINHGRANEADLLDSPGIISLVPNSPDEKVTIDAIYSHPTLGSPSVVIATVDASQLTRHLLLVKQLINAGFDLVVALTMNDILNRNGYRIDTHSMELELGCRVCKIDGRTGSGIEQLYNCVNDILENKSEFDEESRIIEPDYDTDVLIDIYQEIEGIEDRVLLKSSEINERVRAANEALTILKIDEPGKNVRQPDSLTLKLDRILLHKFWGIIIFFLTMSMLFTSIFWLAVPLMDFIDESFASMASAVHNNFDAGWFTDLLSDGLISGAGSVLVFLPQIVILFLILGVLEDIGYLARGAMLIDKPLSKIGLNGRSFVPMLSGFACAIPAMMAARTIPNKRERLLTIFILPLMSCSARLPVFALLIGFLLPPDKALVGGFVMAGIYMFSILSSSIIAGIVNKFSNKILSADDTSSFILELPTYKLPKPKVILLNTYQSSMAYIKKAGPVILVFALVLWTLTYFPNTDPQIDTAGMTAGEVAEAKALERVATSYAADLGKIIQPVMEPSGMDWRVGVSLISAFAAREVFVSSLALIFKVTADDDEALQASLINAMREAEFAGTGEKIFTTSTIIGLIIFFVFALQCLSTVAVAKQETGSWRLPILQLVSFTALAYVLTFIAVNGLRLAGVA